jgi:hypothetical protein
MGSHPHPRIFLKEKEVGEEYLEILQEQCLEYKDLLARCIQEAKDSIITGQ